MSVISNFKNENKCVQFQINNTKGIYKVCFPNTLRRILISYLDCYAIDFERIKFNENNSLFNNEFLKKRLILIPILSNNNEKYEFLELSCEKNNETEFVQEVFTSEFKIKDTTKDTTKDTAKEQYLDISKFIEEDEILFTKLQSNQKINFEAYLKKGNAFQNGASFSPVSSCVVTFNNLNYDKEALIEREKNFDLNSVNDPKIYDFSYESIGFYKPEELIKMAIDKLVEKLNELKEKFDEYEYENNFYHYLIRDENDTIGNLFFTYLLDHKEIEYSGYENVHPLKNDIRVKIKINGKKEKLDELINKTIDQLIEMTNNLKKEFK
jgi:DNA-directed RNA polymerase subunit L